MHGSEIIAKDVLEYVVFEKHIANEYGRWRIHGKIIPDWLPPREPSKKTFIQKEAEQEVEVEDKSTNTAETVSLEKTNSSEITTKSNPANY